MRLQAQYLARNLTRNIRRSALTCAAVALPLIIFVLSAGVIDGLNRFLDNSARQLRLAVSHKASIVNPLPEAYRLKIESLDPSRKRMLAVCGLQWIGGKVEDDPRPLSTLACDADTFPIVFNEYLTSPEERAAWDRTRNAIIVGRDTARQFHWRVGQHITLAASVPPYVPMEFVIISTAEEATDPVTNFCRRDYYDEVCRQEGYGSAPVGHFFVKTASQEDLEHFRAAIDALFARSPDETFTQDEKSFMNQFIRQQFDLPRNVTILCAVTVFVAIMAAANTMSMNFRDRISEFATLKALGFSGGLVFALMLGESLVLCLIGGIIGAGAPYIAFGYTPLGTVTIPIIQTLNIAPSVCLQALLIALGIGLVAGIWPAWTAARMQVVAALRSLE